MTDKVIRVNVTSSKSQKVTVSSSKVANEITASPDTSAYYSRLAKNWAIAEGLVENIDYSSKHYAQESKASADMAKTYETTTQENYNMFMEASINANSELQTNRDGALADINTAKDLAVEGISNTKTTILNDIEFVADGEKKEIEDLIDTGKDELKEAIGDVKVLTTLEIGDIGIAPLGIDETKGKRRYLNGQVIIQEQYIQFTNIIKNSVALNPDLACTESEWQTAVTMSTNGVCYKFVIDDNAGTIRLPKYPDYFIAGLKGVAPVVGNGNILGLYDGVSTGGLISAVASPYTPYVKAPAGGIIQRAGTLANPGDVTLAGNSYYGVHPDPTKSGIEAQLSNNQTEQIKGTYFIQVATGAETEDNIINEIELNNPFSLLDYKYSEYELNNLSWLRSNGQYNSKAVYPAVYDLLLKIYNGTETKAGVSVKLTTETFTDYDFVINTAEETFRLPIKVKLASGKTVVGNGMTLGFQDVNGGKAGIIQTTTGASNNTFQIRQDIYGLPLGSSSAVANGLTLNSSLGITTEVGKSGIELSDSGLYLYFYVGETVQNANLINAGRIEEKIASLIPDNSSLIAGYGMPSDRYVDLTLGASGTTYTAPANGFFVASGKASTGASYGQLWLINETNALCSQVYSTQGVVSSVFIPVKKGDVVNFVYGAFTVNSWRFNYAEGEI